MKARFICELAVALAARRFPDDVKGMSKYCLDSVMWIANSVDSGSHKYIPVQDLNDELGLPQGTGVFGYIKFDDGSYVLQTCSDGLAFWAGGDSDPELFQI